MYIALSEDELREAQASSGLQFSLGLVERVFEHQKDNELARADAFKTDFKDPESLVPLWGNQGHKNDTEYQVLREKATRSISLSYHMAPTPDTSTKTRPAAAWIFNLSNR